MNKAGTAANTEGLKFVACRGLWDQFEITPLLVGCQGKKEDQVSLKEHLDMADSDVCHNRSLALPLLLKFVYLGKKTHFEYPRRRSQGEEPSHQSVGENCKLAFCFAISSALRAPVSSWA